MVLGQESQSLYKDVLIYTLRTKSLHFRSLQINSIRAPDKERIFISIMPISSSNRIFNHLLESSNRNYSNKWQNIGFRKEIIQVEWIELNFTHLIWPL